MTEQNADLRGYQTALLEKITLDDTAPATRRTAAANEIARRIKEQIKTAPPYYPNLAPHPADVQALRDAATDELVRRDAQRVITEQCTAALAPLPPRVQVLEEAAALTNGDRDKTYGPPHINMGAAGRLKSLMRELATRDIGPAELEALDMVMTKISRVITGPAPHRDNYVDGSAYFAIAYENAVDEARK